MSSEKRAAIEIVSDSLSSKSANSYLCILYSLTAPVILDVFATLGRPATMGEIFNMSSTTDCTIKFNDNANDEITVPHGHPLPIDGPSIRKIYLDGTGGVPVQVYLY
jgi:hypothetical protein